MRSPAALAIVEDMFYLRSSMFHCWSCHSLGCDSAVARGIALGICFGHLLWASALGISGHLAWEASACDEGRSCDCVRDRGTSFFLCSSGLSPDERLGRTPWPRGPIHGAQTKRCPDPARKATQMMPGIACTTSVRYSDNADRASVSVSD